MLVGTSPTSTPTIQGYQLLEKLGQGGMGTVFKARQLSMDRLVALKILPPRLSQDRVYLDRFLREARLAGRLNHENVVNTINVGQDGEYHFITMEYVEGQTVQQMIRERGVIPERAALQILQQVTEGLRCAHQHDLVHRDVKPDNIMVDVHGQAKLMDLGLACTVHEDTSLTTTGTALGTPHYVSPEQARGESDIDFRADFYSLGATLYHMLTGTPPFVGDSGPVVMAKHLTEEPQHPRLRRPDLGFSSGVCDLIAWMMEKDPARRPADAQGVSEAIARVLAGQQPQVEAAPTLRRTGRLAPVGDGARRQPRGTGAFEPIQGPAGGAGSLEDHEASGRRLPGRASTLSRPSELAAGGANGRMLVAGAAAALILLGGATLLSGRSAKPPRQSDSTSKVTSSPSGGGARGSAPQPSAPRPASAPTPAPSLAVAPAAPATAVAAAAPALEPAGLPAGAEAPLHSPPGSPGMAPAPLPSGGVPWGGGSAVQGPGGPDLGHSDPIPAGGFDPQAERELEEARGLLLRGEIPEFRKRRILENLQERFAQSPLAGRVRALRGEWEAQGGPAGDAPKGVAGGGAPSAVGSANPFSGETLSAAQSLTPPVVVSAAEQLRDQLWSPAGPYAQALKERRFGDAREELRRLKEKSSEEPVRKVLVEELADLDRIEGLLARAEQNVWPGFKGKRILHPQLKVEGEIVGFQEGRMELKVGRSRVAVRMRSEVGPAQILAFYDSQPEQDLVAAARAKAAFLLALQDWEGADSAIRRLPAETQGRYAERLALVRRQEATQVKEQEATAAFSEIQRRQGAKGRDPGALLQHLIRQRELFDQTQVFKGQARVLDDLAAQLQKESGRPAEQMVRIPAGPVLAGLAFERREVPAFEIDRYEVSNAEYRLFVRHLQAGGDEKEAQKRLAAVRPEGGPADSSGYIPRHFPEYLEELERRKESLLRRRKEAERAEWERKVRERPRDRLRREPPPASGPGDFGQEERELHNQFKAYQEDRDGWREWGQGAGQEELPVTDVSWYAAMAYAKWLGKRLPTALEWEKAAKGSNLRNEFPGGAFDPRRHATAYNGCSRYEFKDSYPCLAPVRAMPEGASPYGCHHLSGNVWEWVAEAGECRGGSWNGDLAQLNLNCRDEQTRPGPYTRDRQHGFRCARNGR